ncbi:MAG: SDR family NAD(P)-dependent oxidoreductase [Clostridia bacterium]|nr:SDR family NAD(P)-dependent oxidoreductase [Clostridia bacterium]
MSLAIITGASSGIGAEFARQLKAEGVTSFWFVARRADKMRSLGEELGVEYKIIEADLSTSEGIEAVKRALEEERPSVDYLLNCAGFGSFGAADEIGVLTIEKMIDLNVKASVLLTHICVPYMPRGSKIVMMGSGSCFTPLPYFNAYSSGKVFILHYTKSLNYELKKYGIRATCFCPGWVETEFLPKAAGENNTTRPRPSAIKPLLKCEKVVAGCIKAMKRGRAMYVTGWYTKLQHLLFKILPDFILTRLWLGMLDEPKEER